MAINNGKISATNTFDGGLVADLNVMSSPSNTVIDALNMEIITVDDNQNIYQNIRGNTNINELGEKVELPIHEESGAQFIPLGLQMNDNIAYIVAGAFDTDGGFIAGMIGTYPSPNWDDLNSPEQKSELYYKFSPLHNYKKFGETEYIFPFISSTFNFKKNKFIDVAIQGDFDSSVNIILTDDTNSVLIINSRFSRTSSETSVKLADRKGFKDSNIYSDDDWDRIYLIQNTNFPIVVDSLVIKEGGYLFGGGYRYFFKYITQEGNTTDILYESPLIPISNGGLGLDKSQTADKSIQFELSNLDSSYSGIRVFFAHFDGQITAKMEIFKINYVYNYSSNDSVVITHTGLESIEPVELSELNTVFTPIDTVKSLVVVNDRLAFGGVSSTLQESDINVLENAAKHLYVWEDNKTITTDYSDPNTAANNLGYWPGEVYELAAVFMLTNKGLSPAFPIVGMDNFRGEQLSAPFDNGEYPTYTLEEDGFEATNLINEKGIFRTSIDTVMYTPKPGGLSERAVKYFKIDTRALKGMQELTKISDGFFIVRRQRVKNVLMQGMMVPTLKLPDKHLSVAPFTDNTKELLLFIANARYLGRYYTYDNPTIGLNAPYKAITKSVHSEQATFNDDFYTVFVPQPTQGVNVVTADKSWIVTGGIGQSVGDTAYGNSIDRDGEDTKKFHMAFFSCELDMNFPAIQGFLNGINPAIETMRSHFNRSPIGVTEINDTVLSSSGQKSALVPTYKSESNLVIRHFEPLELKYDDLDEIHSKYVRSTLLPSGVAIYSNNSFTSKVDRSLGFLSVVASVEDELAGDDETIPFVQAYWNYKNRSSVYLPDGVTTYDGNVISSTSRHQGRSISYWQGFNFHPYSLITQSYSNYIGFTIDKEDGVAATPIFKYLRNYTTKISDFTNPNPHIIDIFSGGPIFYTNLGHIANVFRSSAGRWGPADVRDIFKFDSNSPYNAVTDRVPLTTDSVDVFRGDGFISKIYKRVSYKNGLVKQPGASPTDASLYGIGLDRGLDDGKKYEDIEEIYKKDEGRNLFDNGQIIEIISYANINADIRSVERISPEESAQHSGDRNFYPNKEDMFGDSRPDSAGYNHGYTGDIFPITYFRIEENTPVFSTSFPNRILLSTRNQTQSFFNSFRDIKGFNFRDYGIELGPIIKLVTIKSVLLSIHPTGVLAIGVDDRTLLAEGSDIFINTAESLSPKAYTISDIYGSQHPESLVKTDITVIGVDYRLSAVWMFQGDKLVVISEFAVKTILDGFKNIINKGGLVLEDEGIIYIPRVYSTYDKVKHTILISYVAENPDTREQIHVGSITYNIVMRKWISRISEGNKFGFMVNSNNNTFGFSETSSIWKEDALYDVDGNQIRNTLRGVEYPYEFELVVSDQPAFEKVLDSMLLITNKIIPDTVIYTSSGDLNDAAINAFPSTSLTKTTIQKIITRNASPRNSLRLGILDENAYYKNSGLYIEVGKINSLSRKAQGNRRIRDKNIRIRFKYTGTNPTFIQAVISTLSISYG